MKKIISILVFALALTSQAEAQVVTDIRPGPGGTIGEYGAWTKVDVLFDGEPNATIEYRVRLATRKGIGCHYDLEIKNTSNEKLNIKATSSYYDKLVKSNFGDEAKESLKAGKSVEIRFIAQGCKKEKGADVDDYGACLACEFGMNIHVYRPN